MFCPKCKTEYEGGIKECTDCKIPLVAELSSEPKQGYIEYEEVLSTFNQQDIAIIKSVLDSEAIVYYFKGEYSSLYRPLVIPAILMVKKDHVGKAKDVLKGYNLQYSSIRISDKSKQDETKNKN